MNATDRFVWSVRAQRIAEAFRAGHIDDELRGYSDKLLSVFDPGENGTFATAMRPIWFKVARQLQLRPGDITEGGLDRAADAFEALSLRLLDSYQNCGDLE